MSNINWNEKCIDLMSQSKDTMRGQVSTANMAVILANLKTLGITHATNVCPLDTYSNYPNPQPTAGYDVAWIAANRAAGLNVFFRNTWNAFEGLYGVTRSTPTGSPATALGAAATVLNGTDTTSYLYQIWNFIKTHASYFATGDLWGPCPEPENQGIGAGASNMFTSYSVLGQWLVDIKTVSDNAFSSIGKSGVITGMTSVNGGTVRQNQITSTYWSQIGRCAIDHYVPFSQMSSDLDTISTNAGVDIYINEFGTISGVGGANDDTIRYDLIQKFYSIFNSKSYIKGANYWQSVSSSGAFESVLNDDYSLRPSSQVLKKYFTLSPRISVL